jgi:hypothetical protein
MSGSGREIIARALDELKANVSADDARTFEITSLQDVWHLAREMEREQNQRVRNQYMRRLEPALRSLESYSSVLDTFCQGFSPMAWVWVCFSSNGCQKLRTNHIVFTGSNQIVPFGTKLVDVRL